MNKEKIMKHKKKEQATTIKKKQIPRSYLSYLCVYCLPIVGLQTYFHDIFNTHSYLFNSQFPIHKCLVIVDSVVVDFVVVDFVVVLIDDRLILIHFLFHILES
jgi:hypothetical protein